MLKNGIKKFLARILLFKIFDKIPFLDLKYLNNFLNKYEIVKNNDYVYSIPKSTFLNITNNCNYRCKFCEIHYFYDFAKKKAGKIFSNNISIDFIERFKVLFNITTRIELSGASGEPLMNPNFITISKKFKNKGGILTVTTNGSLLNKLVSKSLVEIEFNKILVSLHAGDKQIYNELQGGQFDDILKNLENLVKIRDKEGSNLPNVIINCLIFKLNQHTIKKLFKKMKEIDIDAINLIHYYGSRNKIKDRTASFYHDPIKGNEFIKEIYQYAKDLNLRLKPEKPIFINKSESVSINRKKCMNPWTVIKFKGCVEYENSHYITVCNRILLFRLNYKKFDGDFVKDIWNHEIIRYLRKNVMKNPICQFCNDPNTPKLRNINNTNYQKKRDKHVSNFFSNVFSQIKVKQRKGIYLFNKNPYEYINYYERL